MDSIFTKYDLTDVDETFPIPDLPADGLVFIHGTSGSGKSTILRRAFGQARVDFDDRPLFLNFSSEHQAESLLIACGLRTVPAWRRPYAQLSTGEQHRAYCAKSLDMGLDFIDEFTSVVDRYTARSLSFAIQRHFVQSGMNRLVIASCHCDIIEWLNPSHVYNTDLKRWHEELHPRGLVRRPQIQLDIKAVDGPMLWELFKRHHYLSGKFNKSAAAFAAFYDGNPVGFSSILRFPNGNFANGWREHRTVVLPEYQGLGIGTALSDTIAQEVLDSGGRFFSKTSHPAFGLHRERSPKWKATSKNGRNRLDYNPQRPTKEDGHKMKHSNRTCWSHEYIGGGEA